MYVCTFVRLYVCMYVCLYVCMYTYVYVCMCMYVCVCMCMYVCMHACMYVCVHTYTISCNIHMDTESMLDSGKCWIYLASTFILYSDNMSCSRIFSFVINNLLYIQWLYSCTHHQPLFSCRMLPSCSVGERERKMDPLVRSGWNPQHLLMKSPSIPGKKCGCEIQVSVNR
jgi:hypothetical protein